MGLVHFLFTISLFSLFMTGCVSSRKYDDLEKKHDTLAEKHKEMSFYLAELEQKLGKASSDRTQLQSSVSSMEKALKEAAERRKQTERRLMSFRDLLRRFKRLTDSGQLTVKMVDGRMVVALPSDILFPSGSATLSRAGQTTIAKVAQVLKGVPNKKFQAEGHTDNVPIRTAKFPSNWELAASRAINVVKTMTKNGLSKDQISATSYGSTRPFQSNKLESGRQANRRIEIVVVPDLSALPGYEELQKMSQEP